MEPRSFHLIPDEIIQAWRRGEYYTGSPPSDAYNHIGLSLALRGWYVYTAGRSGTPQYTGICLVDLKDNSLFLGGIRLYDQALSSNPPTNLVFWGSECSYFTKNDEVVWIYKLFTEYDTHNLVEKKYSPLLQLNKTAKYYEDEKFGLGPTEWDRLLDSMRGEYYKDYCSVEKEHEGNKRPKPIRACLQLHNVTRVADDLLTGEYGQVTTQYSSQDLIAGKIELKRVQKQQK